MGHLWTTSDSRQVSIAERAVIEPCCTRISNMATSLDDRLSLEEQFYKEGHDLGVSDGQRAGQAEGRQFGMQKGFEKFVQMGKLHGRAEVLQAEMSSEPGASPSKAPVSAKARRQVEKLLDLTDIANMQPENSEDAVADVDERLKEAVSKATLIAKITGEAMLASEKAKSTTTDQFEDFQAKTRFDRAAT